MKYTRFVRSRDFILFKSLSKKMVDLGVSPNQISMASIFWAILSAVFFLFAINGQIIGSVTSLLLALICIQLKLVCNLIDGMMAAVSQQKSRTGELFNELPDRITDLVILLSASVIIPQPWGVHLGWLASLAAILTAYIRVLGVSLGLPPDFRGPMAKQHRMFVLSLAVIGSALEIRYLGRFSISMIFGLLLIFVGSLLTTMRRFFRIYLALSVDTSSRKN